MKSATKWGATGFAIAGAAMFGILLVVTPARASMFGPLKTLARIIGEIGPSAASVAKSGAARGRHAGTSVAISVAQAAARISTGAPVKGVVSAGRIVLRDAKRN